MHIGLSTNKDVEPHLGRYLENYNYTQTAPFHFASSDDSILDYPRVPQAMNDLYFSLEGGSGVLSFSRELFIEVHA